VSAAVQINGLDGLQRRLVALGALKGLGPALRAEAEAVAAAARAALASRHGTGALARSIKISDVSQRDRPAFAVGTDDPAGWFLGMGRCG
jgi:hypothetical protein